MAKSWRKRLRRGRLASWLGRIEGVEKPALMVGIGLLLYRVWRNGERGPNLKSRWQKAVESVRRRFGDRSRVDAVQSSGADKRASESAPPTV